MNLTDRVLREVEQRFLEHFQGAGCIVAAEEPLVPRFDTSVLFTNATIIGLKPYLKDQSIPLTGIALAQTCLRSQNIDHAYRSVPLRYLSVFRMLGVLFPPSRGAELLSLGMSLLTRREAIAGSRIAIKVPAPPQRFVGFDPATAYSNDVAGEVLFGTEAPGYYKWRYGLEGITGLGVTFSVRSSVTDLSEDIGNLIELRDSSGQVIAYEFGYGAETLLARKHSLNSPIEASHLDHPLGVENQPWTDKLKDSVASALVIGECGIKAGHDGRARTMKRYLQAAVDLTRRLEVSESDLNLWARNYATRTGREGETASRRLSRNLALTGISMLT